MSEKKPNPSTRCIYCRCPDRESAGEGPSCDRDAVYCLAQRPSGAALIPISKQGNGRDEKLRPGRRPGDWRFR